MLAKKLPGSPDAEPDDAPELTVGMLEDAEVFDGDTFVRRGRGRPPSNATKEKINIRLDPAVLARLRASGPGWQTRINQGLAMLTGVDRKIWNWIELRIADDEKQIEHLQHIVELMETGAMRNTLNNQDITDQSIRQAKDHIKQLKNAIKAMRDTQTDLFGI